MADRGVDLLRGVAEQAEPLWLGLPTGRLPSDLFALATAICGVRPKVLVLDTDLGRGGMALFACSVMDALGFGMVFATGDRTRLPSHRRLHVYEHHCGVAKRVAGAVPLMAVVGGEGLKSVGTWAAMVTPGSYLLVEGTGEMAQEAYDETAAAILRSTASGPTSGLPGASGDLLSAWAVDDGREPVPTRNRGGWMLRTA